MKLIRIAVAVGALLGGFSAQARINPNTTACVTGSIDDVHDPHYICRYIGGGKSKWYPLPAPSPVGALHPAPAQQCIPGRVDRQSDPRYACVFGRDGEPVIVRIDAPSGSLFPDPVDSYIQDDAGQLLEEVNEAHPHDQNKGVVLRHHRMYQCAGENQIVFMAGLGEPEGLYYPVAILDGVGPGQPFYCLRRSEDSPMLDLSHGTIDGKRYPELPATGPFTAGMVLGTYGSSDADDEPSASDGSWFEPTSPSDPELR